MTKRDVIRAVMEGRKPPYVPWSFGFTLEAREKLVAQFGSDDLEPILGNHLLGLGNGVGFFDDIGDDRVRDVFGVVWDRSIDKDIGVVNIGFSLYERAWTMRGMENLMIDFIDNPAFVRELFAAIADYNIAQVRRAVEFEIDAVYFGDDWGQQHGLQMGPAKWHEFIYPEIARMYRAVRDAGKYVFIHPCGDVDEAASWN